MTSRIVFFFGSSRSRRRSATVTSSEPDASSAASIDSSVGYLPVPMKSRERRWTPATTRGSAWVSVVATRSSLPSPALWPCPSGPAPPALPLRPCPSGPSGHLPINGEDKRPPPHEWGGLGQVLL